MILRATWVMVIVYPIVCMLIINKASMWDYFSKPKETFSSFGTSVSHLGQADVFILSTGLVGRFSRSRNQETSEKRISMF